MLLLIAKIIRIQSCYWNTHNLKYIRH